MTSIKEETLFLFDIDGTLTLSLQKISPEMLNMLHGLKKRVKIGFVSGSNIEKQYEQIGSDLFNIFDLGFPENGVQYYNANGLIASEHFIDFIGESNYFTLINAILIIIAKNKCPIRRGNFVELRKSMVNVSPIGRSCSIEEKAEFEEYERKHLIRKEIADEIERQFGDLMNIQCAIGGKISIDIFPRGWDKTACLKFIKQEKIYFFGDMTEKGGNDYELFIHPRVVGVKVTSPEDTILKVNEKLKELGLSGV